MPQSRIKVVDRDGNPLEGIRVGFIYNNGIIQGATPYVWTDKRGVAYVQHAFDGDAELYIGPNYICNIDTPTDDTFTI